MVNCYRMIPEHFPGPPCHKQDLHKVDVSLPGPRQTTAAVLDADIAVHTLLFVMCVSLLLCPTIFWLKERPSGFSTVWVRLGDQTSIFLELSKLRDLLLQASLTICGFFGASC